MKIRSLLLGSAAVAGLSTGAYAADLGVMTSLDVCDSLGISGLTISSDDNCLAISGGVEYEFNWGDYNDAAGTGFELSDFSRSGNFFTVIDDAAGVNDWSSEVYAWLKFVGTADSDFGPASATIVLAVDDSDGPDGGTGDDTVYADEAWVGIGDTTMIMAGKKGSIANMDDDEPLNWLGLYNSDDVSTGVGFFSGDLATGGHVIQIVSDLGNGVSVGGGLEDLNGDGSAVGVLSYKGDTVTAHVTVIAGDILDGTVTDWGMHAGLTATLDNFKLVAAIATDDTGWWNALGSASATFDMFTLAASVEATSASELGFGASAGATVSDGIGLNLGFRWWDTDTAVANDEIYQVAAQLKAAVTETVTMVAEVGLHVSGAASIGGAQSIYYGKGEIDWAPGGGFTSSIAGEVNSLGGSKVTFTAAKDFQ